MKIDQWIYEFDILRVIGIILIILYHGSIIIPCYSFSYMKYFAYFGVSVFFFISGFLISFRENLNDPLTPYDYLKKRFFRIIPLYYVALFTIILFDYFDIGSNWIRNLSLSNIIVHILVLQVFFPKFIIDALWFVSALLLCEIIYVVGKNLFKNILHFTVVIIIINSFILFFSRNGLMAPEMSLDYFIIFFIGVFLGMIWNSNPIKFKGLIPSIPRILSKMSYASYSAFLFHILILAIIGQWYTNLQLSDFTLYMIISLPIIFAISYSIQFGLDKLISTIQKN
jgi:peptidoglycan/LPS O-acetylase OafA/YrhL